MVVKKGKEEEDDEEDPNFDRKLDTITAGAQLFVKGHLLTKITIENANTIIDYIPAQCQIKYSEKYLNILRGYNSR